MSQSQSTVFIVSGRCRAARDAIVRILSGAGLKVVDFPEAKDDAGTGMTIVDYIVERAHQSANAVLVLMTPDEIAFLRRELSSPGDRPEERGPIKQSRPNVIDELGRSMSSRRNKTVLVSMGDIRIPSNEAGYFVERFDGSEDKRKDLLLALEKRCGCTVNWRGPWNECDPFFDAFEQAESRCDPRIERGVPAWTSVESTYYRFRDLFDNQTKIVVRTGHNLADPLRDPFRHFENSVLQNLHVNAQLQVRIVIVPPSLMAMIHKQGFIDMIAVSLPGLWRLKYLSQLTPSEQSRLTIMCHPGALSLSAYIFDPDDGARGLMIVTPRWFTDTHGPSRMFFVVRRSENPALFSSLYDQIPPDLDTYSGPRPVLSGVRTLEALVEDLKQKGFLVCSENRIVAGEALEAWKIDPESVSV